LRRAQHRRALFGVVAVRSGAGRHCRHRRRSAGKVGARDDAFVRPRRGAAARAGRDKVTMFASPRLADFGAWAEQLIAESTGKNGKGLIPIDNEPLGDTAVYGDDRFFIDIRTEGETDAAHEAKLAALE